MGAAPDLRLLALLVGAVFAAALALTRALVPVLRRRALDRPNERSSHVVPTPRGGGIAVLATALPAWAAATAFGWAPPASWAAIGAAGGLALLSFADDLRGLPALVRLVGQAASVALALAWLPHGGAVFQGLLPQPLDYAATAVLWVWLVNLHNFMDGIDGISASGTVCVAGGLALVALLAGEAAPILPAALLAAASAGFLVWNWPPARIFLGDVGSVPSGFLLGWLLLGAAGAGLWAPALILTLYELADATATLLRRVLRGARPWEAHREHYYQRAVQRGLGHAGAVRRVVAGDLLLVLCAILALRWPAPALAASAAIVVLLLRALGAGGAAARR